MMLSPNLLSFAVVLLVKPRLVYIKYEQDCDHLL